MEVLKIACVHEQANSLPTLLTISMRSMLGFIFRNRGPLLKVCCGADTHARSQTASRGRMRLLPKRSSHLDKTQGSTARWRRMRAYTIKNRPHAFKVTMRPAPTITPVFVDFVSTHGRQWVLRPTGGEESHSLSVGTDIGEDTSPKTYVSHQRRVLCKQKVTLVMS
jgi:hypothetical protein